MMILPASLMPLIDAHVHVVAVDQMSFSYSQQPITFVTLQRHAFLEGVLRRGFTTVRDTGSADAGLAEQ